MALIADVVVRRGDFTLDVSFRVPEGETLALLGPNGSGKSTLLATVAGLLAPERGAVAVGGRTVTLSGPTAREKSEGQRPIHVLPHERKIGLLGQDPLLFPHLSSLENVAFGSRARGQSRVAARRTAETWLEAVGLSGLGARRPSELSGGQQQRAAIARALAAEPDALLLDEPMASLDVENATLVRSLLRERLSAMSVPTVVVTHDVVDAMVLADRVAILDGGRIIDIGGPEVVLGQPVNLFAARLAGLNFLEGVADGDNTVRIPDGRRLAYRTGDGSAAESRGTALTVVFPPSAVRVSLAQAATAESHAREPSTWAAMVGPLERTMRGVRVPFSGETVVAELSASEVMAAGIREGSAVTVSVDPHAVSVYPMRNPTPSRSACGTPRRY